MWIHEGWGPFPWMWIFPVIFLIVLLLFLFRTGGLPMCGGRDIQDVGPSAREILDRRYARGEINREEYQRMKQDLN